MPRRFGLAGVAVAAAVCLVVALSGCTGYGVPQPKGVPAETTAAFVFFSTGRTLLEEPRVIDASDKYGSLMKEWLAGTPTINTKVAVVQPTAKVRSVTLKDGLLTIDWDRSVLDFKAEPREKLLAWAAILETFGQFPEVKKVKFTVEGKTSGEIGGKDVQAFWGRIGLKGQPWASLRPPDYVGATNATTSSAEPSGAPGAQK